MRGIDGHLDLVCGPDDRGISTLIHQSFRAPFHISKPHRDGDTLVVNAVSVSPGLMEGDTLRCTVAVRAGASLLLTQPAATRAHRAAHGTATLDQRFTVAAGGRFEFWPELFIPQSGSNSEVRTRIETDARSTALHFDWIAPGRVASGENCAFSRLRWTTDLVVDGQRILRDTADLDPDHPALAALRAIHPAPFWGTGILAGESDPAPLVAAARALHSASCWVGFSSPAPGVRVAKVFAADALSLRTAARALRHAFHAALGSVPPDLRRT
jgi:urease accessory protein